MAQIITYPNNPMASYVSWLRASVPDLYQAALKKAFGKQNGLQGLGKGAATDANVNVHQDPSQPQTQQSGVGDASMWGAIATAAGALVSAYATDRADVRAAKVNLALAQRGIQPADYANTHGNVPAGAGGQNVYPPGMYPGAGFSMPMSDTTKMMLIGGGALLVLAVVMKKGN